MSDKAVLRLVGKLVSRATTLMFCTFPDSDRNIMKNAEQANRRTSQSIPDGMVYTLDDFDFPPSGTEGPPSGINSTDSIFAQKIHLLKNPFREMLYWTGWMKSTGRQG